MNNEKYVVYYRVSTQKQSLGIDAQKTMVKGYLRGKKELLSFTEKESGKSDKNRPELQKALAVARKEKAILLVATLSRLSRDLHFITSLSKSKVNFRVCDMPDASPLTINIMGAIAQYEREVISARTKRALAEVKKQGKSLGADNPKVREALKKVYKQRRQERKEKLKLIKENKLKNPQDQKYLTKRELDDQKVSPLIKTLRRQGLSWRAITDELNSLNMPTRQCGKWHLTSLKRVAKRNDLFNLSA